MAIKPDIPLAVPDRGTIDRMRASAYQITRRPLPLMPPHPIQLQTLSAVLNDRLGELVNATQFSPESFKRTHAATQIEVGGERRLQVVSFSDDYSRETGLDALLKDPDAWNGKSLAVGGLTLDPGGEPVTLGVLLERRDGELRYRLVGAEEKSGRWSLLKLEREVERPYTFFTSQWVGFSQRCWQAALRFPVPSGDETVATARAGVATLFEKGLLPPGTEIAAERARATVVDAGHPPDEAELPELQIEADADQPGVSGDPGQDPPPVDVPPLEPNLVVAPAAQCREIEIAASEVIVGVAMVKVLSNIWDAGWNDAGTPVVVPPRDYRLDVVDLDADPYGQLWDTDTHHVNIPLAVVEGVGEAIEGDPVDDGEIPELVIGCLLITYCSHSGTGSQCGAPPRKRRKKRIRIF